jgi:pantoate--beta-alanine ligase
LYLRFTKLQNLYKIDIKVLSLLALKVLLMIIENKIKNVEEIIKKNKILGNKICLIPTMGSLHKGHISLVKEALKMGEMVWVSIFVNPTQFNELDDYEKYPRSLNDDISKLKKLSHKICIFSPSTKEIYTNKVKSDDFDFGFLESIMEGKFRPNHFNGVATIVTKLFEIFIPDYCFFGEKDYQQVVIIKKIIETNFKETKMIICDTIREKNGLAISSRNCFLSKKKFMESAIIYKMLVFARNNINKINFRLLENIIAKKINEISGFELEYLDFRDANSLKKISTINSKKHIRAFICVKVNGIRLIDNIELK